MIPENKKSFILHADYENYYNLLESDSERVKWTRASFAWQNGNEGKITEILKTMLPATRMFWEFTKANFQRDNEKWEDKKREQEAYREKKRLQKEEERKRKREEYKANLSPSVADSRQVSPPVPNVANTNVNTNANNNINNNIKGKVKGTENTKVNASEKVGSANTEKKPTNQEKLLKFQKEFPSIVIDTKFSANHDYALLAKAVAESKTFLSDPNKKITLSLILNNYDKVISGEWKDFSTFKKEYQGKPFKGRNYTAEELNSLFDTIEEIEV